ncbi:uncharacterized protein N7446_012033 [Penicillium canescens]|uniref:uncharacterized protein n=1 Tax=Penicillium canescens TaxID=5083 RepID=UPI0026E1095A|nr:uncharacterized protein N7446_012033 [Penicillium canescens]KAJ6047199.1 hypothetical protein N7446_012033 [Penicillium canescens]
MGDTTLSAISSSRVILRDSTNWEAWLSTIRGIADQYNVWELCDPDKKEQPVVPDEPEPSSIEAAKNDDPVNWYKIVKLQQVEWSTQVSKHGKRILGLNCVATVIKNSLHPSYQTFITHDTPWKLLRNLRQRFAPECDPTYAAKLRQQWRNLDRGLDRNTDIEKWLLNWETIQVRCARAGMSEANDATVQFLDAISTMSPGFHETWTLRLEDKNVVFPELLTRYKAHWAISHGKASTQRGISKAVFSTWQGHEEAQPPNIKKGAAIPATEKPFWQRPCPCGSKARHPAWKCWAAYESGRPEGYKIIPDQKQKWDRAMKADPTWKDFIEKKRSEMGMTQKQAHSTIIDDQACGFFSKVPSQEVAQKAEQAAMSTQTKQATIPMEKQWVVDTGADTHVCNDRSKFVSFRESHGNIKVGDTRTRIDGVGTVVIYGTNPTTGQPKRLELGAFMCFRNNWIETDNGKPLLKIYQEQKLSWLTQPDAATMALIEAQAPPGEMVFTTKRSAQEPKSAASMETWHRRLGHIGPDRITKLSEMTEGVTITESNPVKQVCEACQLADAPKQISRRKIGQAYGVFGRVHFDLVQNQPAHNGHIWLTHFYLDGIKCHFVFTHTKKNECQMAVRKFIAIAKNWLNINIKVFHYDNERSAGDEVEMMIENEGCIIEHAPPGLPEMNDLPRTLWPEAIYAAAYMLNRVPTKIENRWIVPWKELMRHTAPDGVRDQIVNLSNLRLYGCLAYSRIIKRVQSDKMAPRAEIGFLVGYVSKNLYKIWFPHKGRAGKGRVDIVRDAIFDETRRYSPSTPVPEHEEAVSTLTDGLDNWPEVLTLQEAETEISIELRMPMVLARNSAGEEAEHTKQGEEAGKPTLPLSPKTASILPVTPESIRPNQISWSNTNIPGSFPTEPRPPRISSSTMTSLSQDPLIQRSTPSRSRLPNTLSSSPDPISVIPSIETEGEETVSESEMQLQQELAQSPQPTHPTAIQTAPRPGYEIAPARAPRDISRNIDQSNIITSGSRSRRPRTNRDFSAYLSLHDEDPADNPPELLHAFTISMHEQASHTKKHHRNQMPIEPQNWAEMKNHKFAKEFTEAAAFEIETLRNKGTFREVSHPNTKGTQVLPLKWVFTYKYDADGVLEKFKARICVRGDLQWITTEEKRAATLAVKTARAVFALVAAFDLDMIQRDVVTAFLNSAIQGEVYTKCPPGFERSGHCWLLLRALYGLRMSPRLWQQEATRVLVKLGLTPVPEDPCIFTTQGIIVFFYVDDIIMVNHPSYSKQAATLDQEMKKQWELRELDASWFLNIRILRDRSQKKLWLCQDSYIESMTSRYNLKTNRRVETPMSTEPLLPYDGVATPSQIHGYQAKVGSAQYATTVSRPDAAKATAKAAEFLMNPGPKHIDAIDRIIQYLYKTRFWAIEYGVRGLEPGIELAAKSVEFASDASFGDNPDRRSSEGYVCKLYGGPIDWKASKQKTVTTSTTEAELLALAEAGKTVQWWRRVLRALGFEPSHPLTILCDSQQTVDLLTKEGAAMHTKLRHVDINRCWMKQEVSEGRVLVAWIPTAEMPADGLTKALPKQKQQIFRDLIGMRDVNHLIHPSKQILV